MIPVVVNDNQNIGHAVMFRSRLGFRSGIFKFAK